jgi:UrcA family protein
MFRHIVVASSLLFGGIGWAGAGQAESRVVYTYHALQVDVRDLDLGRDAGRRVFWNRIAKAADDVCGGRPDRGNRYEVSELKRLLPAFEKCRNEAIQRVDSAFNVLIRAPAPKLVENDEK